MGVIKDWAHQSIAVTRFKTKEFFGLLFDCGTGKTRTAIKIAEEKEMPVLVIAPDNLLTVWEDAIKEHATKETDFFLYNSKKKNTKKYQEAFEQFLEASEW